MSGLFAFDGVGLSPIEVPAKRAMRWVAWRPDGRESLLVGNRGEVLRLKWSARNGVSTCDPVDVESAAENFRGVAWSPDGAQALVCGNRGSVFIGDGERMRRIPAPTTENLRRVAWAPDGSFALIVGNGGTVLRFDAPSGAIAAVPGDRAHTMRSVAWRPDGAYALIGGYASRHAGYPRPYTLYRCDGRFVQGILATDDEDDAIAIDWQPGVDPSRATILIARYEGEGGVVPGKIVQYDGSGFTYRTLRALMPGRDKPAAPRRVVTLLGLGWHPSGTYALLCGEQGKLLRLEDGAMRQVASGTRDNLVGPFWQPAVPGPIALLLRGPDERVYTV